MPAKLSKEIILQRLKDNNTHMNIDGTYLYGYERAEFKGTKKDWTVTCFIHGDFSIIPENHWLQKQGCRLCGIVKGAILRTKSQEQFEQELKDKNIPVKIIGKYKRNNIGIQAECTNIGCDHGKDGNWLPLPANLCNCGHACPKCGGNLKKSNEQFLVEAEEIHGKDKFSYLTEYQGVNTKVHILCLDPTCNHNFWQWPNDHIIKKCGCPKCKLSHGAREISLIFDKNNIKYKIEYVDDYCKGIKRKLPFDFYLNDYNILIEYDGEQHFKPKSFGIKDEKEIEENFNSTQRNDQIKTNFCGRQGINLIRIAYTENIQERMIKLLNYLKNPII